MIDGDGLVQVWSRALAEITGVDAGAAVGRPLAELLDLPAAEERDRLLPVSVEQPRTVAELKIRRRDGEDRRLRLAHSAIFTAGCVTVLPVFAFDQRQPLGLIGGHGGDQPPPGHAICG